MKDVKAMSYKELETEVLANRREMLTASAARKRELIHRNHDIMTEMDRMWDAAEKARTQKEAE